MSTFNLSAPIYLVDPYANVDSRYGPWNSLTDANTSINFNVRGRGLTVGIIENNQLIEYWYRDGIQDQNLTLKTIEPVLLNNYLPLSGGTITNNLSVGLNLTANNINIAQSLTAFNRIRAINQIDTANVFASNNCNALYYNFLPIKADNFFNIIMGRGFGPQNQTAPNIQSSFSGGRNTIIGYNAGYPITTGSHNTFIGVDAGRENRTGSFNFALGATTLNDNRFGSRNIGIGQEAGAKSLGDDNIFIGQKADVRSSPPSLSAYRNIIIGQNSTAGGFDDTLVIGRSTDATESGQLVLSSINGVFRTTLSTFNIGSINRPNSLTVFGNISTNSIIYSNNQNSNDWNSVYSSVLSNSANWNLGGGGGGSIAIFEPVSGNWNSVYSSVLSNSANWNSVYSSVLSNSASWNSGNTSTVLQSKSAIWDNTTNIVNSASSTWNEITDFNVTYSADVVFNIPSNRIVRGKLTWLGTSLQTLTAVLPKGREGGNSDPFGAKNGDIVEILNFNPTTPTVKFQSYENIIGSWSTEPTKIIYQASSNLYTQTLKFVYNNIEGWQLEKNADKYKHNGLDPINPLSILALPLSGGNISGNLTVQQKISSQESISNSLSSQTVKISNVLFTGKSTTAAALTGDNLFIEVFVNNKKKYLQLFDIELPLLIYVIDFENSSKGTYDPSNINLNGLLWYMNNALIGTLVGDYKIGLKSGRLRGYANSEMRMIESKETGLGTISFTYRAYAGDVVQIEWLVQYSMDEGLTWTTVGSFTATDFVQTFNATINQQGNGRVRIIANTNLPDANRRTNVDNIVITEFL